MGNAKCCEADFHSRKRAHDHGRVQMAHMGDAKGFARELIANADAKDNAAFLTASRLRDPLDPSHLRSAPW